MKTLAKSLFVFGFFAGMLTLASCNQESVSPESDSAQARATASDTCSTRRN